MYNLVRNIQKEPMKHFIYFIAILNLVFSTLPSMQASAQETSQPEDNAGAIVCPPGVYLQSPTDCLPLGPSEYLTQMARLGIILPLQPLAALKPDASLNNLPYLYYKVNNTGTSFYPSLDAAIGKAGAAQTLAPGALLYVTYTQALETKKGTYFLLPSGEWMPGDGERSGVGSTFQGLEFRTTPQNAFGWVLDDANVRKEPNYIASNQPIRTLRRFDIVQVYSSQSIEGNDWYLIGPDEWVEGRQVAAVFPASPPDGVLNGRWIDVNLAEQTLAVYDNQALIFATLISTGVEPFWTRPGLFPIYKKKEVETMSGSFEANRSDYYYLEAVPWTMYFDNARALHGAYWAKSFYFGYPQSHGCVNLSVGDSHWLFNWAKEGDWVYVHDPSGITPTDPAKYGEGGA
jgi:hypothetical protein